MFGSMATVQPPTGPEIPSGFSADMSAHSVFEPMIPIHMEPMPDDEESRRQFLEEQLKVMLERAQHEDEFGPTEEEDFDLVHELEGLGLVAESSTVDPEDITEYFNTASANREYFPYPSKVMLLLDILDNLPRLRLSANSLRLIIWILNYLGVSGVPSYNGFRKLQDRLRKQCGSEPVLQTSSLGNVFYVNDIRESIAKDFSNPEIAKHLHFYPEETSGPIAEVWQATRWKEFKPSELTPMYARGLRHFYIDELCQHKSGEYVIPRDWVIRNKVLTARCSIVSLNTSGWTIDGRDKILPATELEHNYDDILAHIGSTSIPWKVGELVPEMPNPLRKMAQGKELYVVMVPLWCDDVSGNRSKQYNKHMNMYTVNSNLPGRLLQQEYFIRFVSASPHATAPEQFSALRTQITATNTTPIECYNAHTHRECCVMLRVPGLPADNPQQSEEASHMGGNANMNCRRCTVGGPPEVTESDEGYHALHKPGPPRTLAGTKECLQTQLRDACHGIEKKVTDLQTDTGTKDKITQHWIDILIQKSREQKALNPGHTEDSIATKLEEWLNEQPGEKMNPLLSLPGLDPTHDTPIEILHTILLGIIKYVWHMLNTTWSDEDRALFAIRLQSTDLNGLSIPRIQAGYMLQYRNNLIGKHFKSLMQTLPFAVHGLVSTKQFALVKAVGTLGAVLWMHEIIDMEDYLAELEVLVANVLDAFSDLEPEKILVKMKLHLLVHLPEDVRRYGPAIHNSTEIFECFNAVFRLCSVYSNHQAPSRDIANKFASMDRLKHVISGGYWKENGEWVHASDNVHRILKNEPIIQRHLGWVPECQPETGTIEVPGKEKCTTSRWIETLASKVMEVSGCHHEQTWCHGLSVVSQTGDKCRIKSWVYFLHSDEMRIGRIAEIIKNPSSSSHSNSSYITLEPFMVLEDLHESFDLPVIRRIQEEQNIVVTPCDIQFVVSVQHDCRTANCSAIHAESEIQERQKTLRTYSVISHADDDIFLINLYALHNAALTRKALPKTLITPRAMYADRKVHHSEIATALRVTQNTKRKQRQEKQKATRAKNLEAKRKAQDAREAADTGLRTDIMDEGGGEGEINIQPGTSGEQNSEPSRKRQRKT